MGEGGGRVGIIITGFGGSFMVMSRLLSKLRVLLLFF